MIYKENGNTGAVFKLQKTLDAFKTLRKLRYWFQQNFLLELLCSTFKKEHFLSKQFSVIVIFFYKIRETRFKVKFYLKNWFQ